MLDALTKIHPVALEPFSQSVNSKQSLIGPLIQTGAMAAKLDAKLRPISNKST